MDAAKTCRSCKREMISPENMCMATTIPGQIGKNRIGIEWSQNSSYLRTPNKTDPDPLAERKSSSFEKFCPRP